MKIIQLPVSKSDFNRLKMLEAYSQGFICLDTPMQEILPLDSLIMAKLITEFKANHISSKLPLKLNCGEAGTVLRFTLPYLAHFTKRPISLQLEGNLKNRPIIPLLEILQSMGGIIDSTQIDEGLIHILPSGGLKSVPILFKETNSSQFISSLILMAPFIENGLEINWQSEQKSVSYIDLTLSTLDKCGIIYKSTINGVIINYQGKKIANKLIKVERDFSSLPYILCHLLLKKNKFEVLFPNLHLTSSQGDKAFIELINNHFIDLKINQVNEGIIISSNNFMLKQRVNEIEMYSMPDQINTLVCLSIAFNKAGKIKGVNILRDKESDRLFAIIELFDLLSIPYQYSREEDFISFGKVENHFEDFECLAITQRDHRLVMSSTLLAYRIPKIEIKDRNCVEKSFPRFWEVLSEIELDD